MDAVPNSYKHERLFSLLSVAFSGFDGSGYDWDSTPLGNDDG